MRGAETAAVELTWPSTPGARLYRVHGRSAQGQPQLVYEGPDCAATVDAAFDELRIEVVTGDHPRPRVLRPWYSATPPRGDGLALAVPRVEPDAPAWRVRAYGDGQVVSTAVFTGRGVELDVGALPRERAHTWRLDRWDWAAETWRPVGGKRVLPGFGLPTAAPPAAADPGRSAAVADLLLEALTPAERRAGHTVRFFVTPAHVADAVLDGAEEAELRACAAWLYARLPLSELKFMVTETVDGEERPFAPFRRIVDPADLWADLRRGLQSGATPSLASRGLPLLSAHDDIARNASLTSSFLFYALPEGACFRPGSLHLELAEEIFRRCDPAQGSRLVREALNYLRAFHHVSTKAVETQALKRSFFAPDHFRVEAEGLLADLAGSPDPDGALFSSLVLDAKLRSLVSRDHAAAGFRAALAAPGPAFDAFDFDHGAATYFSAGDLAAQAQTLAARKRELISSLEVLGRPKAQGDLPVLLCSCDPAFLAIYLPNWLASAEYVKGLGIELHFVVNADPAAAREALERADRLRRALAELRGYAPDAYADNVSYSICPPPAYCPHPPAFYAAARYLLAAELVRRFGRAVLVQDMDFVFQKDPAPFLAELPKRGLGFQASTGIYGLDPWRRFLAGCFFLPNAEPELSAMAALEDYLLAGLAERRSWYLDQNALAYLFEHVVATHGHELLWPLSGTKRPTAQPAVNKVYERAHLTRDPAPETTLQQAAETLLSRARRAIRRGVKAARARGLTAMNEA